MRPTRGHRWARTGPGRTGAAPVAEATPSPLRSGRRGETPGASPSFAARWRPATPFSSRFPASPVPWPDSGTTGCSTQGRVSSSPAPWSRWPATRQPGVKFSVRQILASAAGAVIAAVIASTCGVKGTIIGVAIGSAAATLGTALVAQSIERGHEAVRQVVERVPDSSASTLLRRLGSTDAAGAATSRVDQVAPTEVVEGVKRAEAGVAAGARDDTVRIEATATPA